MKPKYMLLIGAVILLALCGYFFNSSAPKPLKPSNLPITLTKPQSAQISSTVSGESQIETPATLAVAEPSESLPLALTVAKLTLPLAFADTGENPDLRQTVVRDLQMVYGHLSGHEIVNAGVMPPVMVKGVAVIPTKLINYTGAGRYFPKVIDGEIGYVGNVDGSETLLITAKVISAYREAMDRRSAQPAAYEKIYQFVDDLNLLATKPISDPSQMFVLDPTMANQNSQLEQISPQVFVQQFGGQQYRAPSLLEIIDGAQISDQYKGRLVAKLYVHTESGLKDNMPPIIFDQGQWKFLIVSPPT